MKAIGPRHDSTMTPLTELPAWQSLQAHWQDMEQVRMRDLFDRDPKRFESFSLEACGILLDYSKNLLDGRTRSLLLALADEADVRGWIRRMFAGERINATEHRSVLHVALRNRSDAPVLVDGLDVMPHVTCKDHNAYGIDSILIGHRHAGIETVLLMTGDKPVGAKGVFELDSIGLLRRVRRVNNESYIKSTPDALDQVIPVNAPSRLFRCGRAHEPGGVERANHFLPGLGCHQGARALGLAEKALRPGVHRKQTKQALRAGRIAITDQPEKSLPRFRRVNACRRLE